MLRHRVTFRAGMVSLALATLMVVCLAGPVAAFAAGHKPVVKAISPAAGSTSGGATVTITGKNFKVDGKSVVTKVAFGKKAATHVRVKSSTKLTVKAPAGSGTVNVRVTTKSGTSAKIAADKYTYLAPAAKYLVTPSTYAPVAGTDVVVSAQLASAGGTAVHTAGIQVTWSKTGTGGSFGSATSTTDAGGVATVTFTTAASAGTSYTVTATDGKSRQGTCAAITTTSGVATQVAVNSGDGQSASAGTAVSTPPSVIVEDAHGDPVAGVTVTFSVGVAGGSVTGSPAVTNASGIAAAGSWTLAGTPGSNTLTAVCPGLSGSPVLFNATGEAGILQVQHNGSNVRTYSLAQLQALTPFVGLAGLFKNPEIGPDAVTGVKVLDIVQDALGTPLASGQSVDVAEVDATPYNKTMSYELLANMAGITMYDASRTAVASPIGPLAAILIYSDPSALVMKAGDGPLRFAIADASNSETLVFAPTNLSVSKVNQLNVITP
jgi:hypothetical protein